jgi:cardiolipin synthase
MSGGWALSAGDGHDRERVFTLPNIITIARLLAVPATVWLMLAQRLDLAFIIFLLAGISDGVDGFLARRLGLESELGALLDPIADKALLSSVMVLLAWLGLLPVWLAVLVVGRDVMIIAGYGLLWLLGLRPPIAPLLVSKLNTFAQIALAATALCGAGFGWPGQGVLAALLWLAAGTTFVSGLAYALGARRMLTEQP